jgi:hypothetical protein
MDVRTVGTRDIETHRFRARREQQGIEALLAAVGQS